MGPVELLLVRHGESLGNVAAAQAVAAGADTIEVDRRDADVPLSALGEAQAAALGGWLREQGDPLPDAVWSSPYLRARQTTHLALTAAACDVPVRVDERLRDRELGVLDLLTSDGVARRFPTEAQRRQWLGKMYYRPPGGESWADVALRLRSWLVDLDQAAQDHRVLVVAHDALVLLTRYVCEELTEDALMTITRDHTVANTSLTRLVRPTGRGRWQLAEFNTTGHLHTHDTPPTTHPGRQP